MGGNASSNEPTGFDPVHLGVPRPAHVFALFTMTPNPGPWVHEGANLECSCHSKKERTFAYHPI